MEAVNDGSYDLNYAVHVLAESGFYWDIANAVGFPSINDFAVDDIDDELGKLVSVPEPPGTTSGQ